MSMLRKYGLLSGIKVVVKAKWFGQVRVLSTGMKLCFLVFVYLYKYKHFL